MLINRLVITWKYKKYICINIGINSLLLGDATWCHKTCSSFSSDNGLWLIRHQALTWTNADSLAIEPLGTNREIWIKIQAFSLAKKWNDVCKMAAKIKFYSCLNVFILQHLFVDFFGIIHHWIQECCARCRYQGQGQVITVETLYSTIYYSKYFIELKIDKSTQYVALCYGVSFMSTTTEIDRGIKVFYCTSHRYCPWYLHLAQHSWIENEKKKIQPHCAYIVYISLICWKTELRPVQNDRHA